MQSIPSIDQRIASIEEKLDLLLAHLKVKNTPERSRKEIESLADRVIMDIQQKKRRNKK